MNVIYLDNNATSPVAGKVYQAMQPFLTQEFGNPSAIHATGRRAGEALENARRQVARLLNTRPKRIVFTGVGSEADNQAIKGIAFAHADKGKHIITSSIEHPAILEVCRFLEGFGFKTTYLPVDEQGLVRESEVEASIRPETILITIMHANNEVGTIQPVKEISRIAKARGIVMHTDAAQSIGKIPTFVSTLGVDLLSMAGHKIYAPKGIGALYIRQSVMPEKFCHGAGQEMGLRAGTENVSGIVGLGKACEIAARDLKKSIGHLKMLRDRLQDGLFRELDQIKPNGHPEKRLPNTLSLCFKGLEANRILEEIGLKIAASAGAACHSDTVEISHVLEAMNVPLDWAKGTLRFSVGRMTTVEQIDKAIQVIVHAMKKLQSTPQ